MVVVPIGFVSDHMEVVYDLDTEAAATAETPRAADFARAATAGVHPRFVAMVRDLLLERAAAERGEPSRAGPPLGALGPAGTCARAPAAPTPTGRASGPVRGGPAGDSVAL